MAIAWASGPACTGTGAGFDVDAACMGAWRPCHDVHAACGARSVATSSHAGRAAATPGLLMMITWLDRSHALRSVSELGRLPSAAGSAASTSASPAPSAATSSPSSSCTPAGAACSKAIWHGATHRRRRLNQRRSDAALCLNSRPPAARPRCASRAASRAAALSQSRARSASCAAASATSIRATRARSATLDASRPRSATPSWPPRPWRPLLPVSVAH
mmetsp:Transcript_35287/g.104382  ORF Transcript_35287/g.104382 Transcript_35287/m.104382 type:complete len:218 (+) Transcript_35287:600-1253(+)